MARKGMAVISLFSGAMGLDLGLEQAGFSIRVAIECNEFAVQTIRRNRPNLPVIDKKLELVPTRDVLEKAGLHAKDVAVVTGGPACQAFSTAGSRESLGDPRGILFREFLRVVHDIRPRFFVMENVKGILSAPIRHRPLNERGPGFPELLPEEELGSGFKLILRELRDTGYYIIFGLLNAADYGVPQTRERMVFIGSRDGELITLPKPTHARRPGRGMKRWVTLRKGLEGLIDHNPEYKELSTITKEYLGLIPEGGNWRNLPEEFQAQALGAAYRSWGGRVGFLRRLDRDRPSPALTTDPKGRATMLCHPTETRPLSIRECARLQQFPDNWIFVGSKTQRYMQIGNAVPVGLGKAIGHAIQHAIETNSHSTGRLSTVEAAQPDLLDRISRRPRTILNPPRMREVKTKDAVGKWFNGRQRNRSDIRDYLSQLNPAGNAERRIRVSHRNVAGSLRSLRWKAHRVTILLHQTYGSPRHGNKDDPLDELIFIVLSQMTTHPSFNRVFDRLKEAAGSWDSLLGMPLAKLRRLIANAGLSNQKAPRIKAILKRIRKDFGEVSLDALRGISDQEAEDYLTSLPGVGVKTAKCVTMYSLGRQVLPVDTHVARVARRLGLLAGSTDPAPVHRALEHVVPPPDRYAFHVNALSHGQTTCLALRPKCSTCPLTRLCEYYRTSRDL